MVVFYYKRIISIRILQYLFYVITIRIFVANQQKWGWGFANQSQNIIAGFSKTNTVQYFLLMFLIDAIKPKVEKKFKNCVIFLCDCLGEVSCKRTKPVLFIFALCLLAATKTLLKRSEKSIIFDIKPLYIQCVWNAYLGNLWEVRRRSQDISPPLLDSPHYLRQLPLSPLPP